MKIASIQLEMGEVACIKMDQGFLPIPLINQRFKKDWPVDLFSILTDEKLPEIQEWFLINRDDISADFKDLSIPRGISRICAALSPAPEDLGDRIELQSACRGSLCETA